MAALIKLCADICKRNGIKALKWQGNKDLIGQPDKQNMTVHRWFSNTSCPGDYLYERHGYIADEVNKLLGTTVTNNKREDKINTPNASTWKVGDIIHLKSNATYYNGDAIPSWVFKSTLYYRGTNENGVIFSTQKTGMIIGVVKVSNVATHSEKTDDDTPPETIYTEGDVIKLKKGATYWNGQSIPSWVFEKTLYYRGKTDKGIIFSTLKTGACTGVVAENNVIKVSSTVAVSTTKFPYMVKIVVDVLNIRTGPGTNHKVVGAIRDRGTYTIVEEQNGWGRLLSGAGWIYLGYTQKRG
jgi:hypothetical protein